MKIKCILSILFSITLITTKAQLPATEVVKAKGGDIVIQPIKHATMVLSFKNMCLYVDPTGGADAFKGLQAPDMIVITDIHGDHMDPKTIEAINSKNATLIVPQAVADKLPTTIDKQKIVVLNNGDEKTLEGIIFEAIPMYNLPEEANAPHTKGRGNGYVLTMGGKRIYISGDTEDIEEMRTLKNIDVAFVCMNLPYTMDVTQAASGVLAFKPKVIIPYHYRGQDVNVFKKLVNEGNKDIEVKLLEWYPIAK